jgi:hypothetical protein
MRTGFGLWSLLLAGTLASAGCTQIPRAEFGAYRESFDGARAAGEQVLEEYAVDRQRQRDMNAAAAPSKPPDPFAFDPAAVAAPADAADDIEVRLKAWQVLDDYGDALSRLAEGAGDAAVAGAVDGLIGDLKAFPLDVVASAGGAIAPLATDVVKKALGLMQREAEARAFRRALNEGAPIAGEFIRWLVADCDNFYKLRRTLRDVDKSRLADAAELDVMTVLALSRDRAHDYAVAGPPGERPDALPKLLDRISKSRRSMTPEADVLAPEPPPAQPAPYTVEVAAQIQAAADRIDGLAGDARKLDEQLLAYRDVMSAYVRLLHRLQADLDRLASAANQQTRTMPDVERTVRLALDLRRALADYRRKR